MKPEEFDTLLERHLDGSLTPSEQKSLTTALNHDWAQQRFVERMMLDADLRERGVEMKPSPKRSKSIRLAVFVAMGVLLLSAILNEIISRKPIALLVSSNHASWESPLPTTPNSKLLPGYLKLKSGVATIQFRSGAEIQLEAPAHIILETPMKATLLSGAALVEVPERAIGFTLNTPSGRAVDLGTEFTVLVDPQNQQASFEVLSGEIEVHHKQSSEAKILLENEMAIVNGTEFTKAIAPIEMGSLERVSESIVRVGTKGMETSVISSNKRQSLHHDMLMVKRSSIPKYERKSIFSFDLSDLKDRDIGAVNLRLNLVPSGLGRAIFLKEVSSFSIHHLPGDSSQLFEAKDTLQWQQLAAMGVGKKLASFDVSKGQQIGSFSINDPALLHFIRSRKGARVTFLISRDTLEAKSNGLVHAFAASTHPEASGPILEITLQP